MRLRFDCRLGIWHEQFVGRRLGKPDACSRCFREEGIADLADDILGSRDSLRYFRIIIIGSILVELLFGLIKSTRVCSFFVFFNDQVCSGVSFFILFLFE